MSEKSPFLKNRKQLKTGSDPRMLPDYTALRDELAKLTHPARPDVEWRRVEQLSLSLFRQNGVELQTASWYTLARTHLAGMTGLNEGLAILDALLTHQWATFWPQPVHARMEILAGLSQRLQSVLRKLALHYDDLPRVYEAEKHLSGLRDVLQRLELKNASQVGELCTFMHNAATRLENRDVGSNDPLSIVLPSTSVSMAGEASEPLIYAPREETVVPYIVTAPSEPVPKRPWKAFFAGMLAMLILGAAGLWGWRGVYPVESGPVPVGSTESSLTALEQIAPLWVQEYGFTLASRAKEGDTERLRARWQQYLSGNALPVQSLSGWHQGMEGLQALTRRLDALDERKGKYLTGSELKSMVFAITQDFARAIPVEEQLYRLSQASGAIPPPSVLQRQTDEQFNQLLNRYMLIKQQIETR